MFNAILLIRKVDGGTGAKPVRFNAARLPQDAAALPVDAGG